MKYTVMLGVNNFEFDDGATAMNFAELAGKYFVPNEYSKTLKPLITIEEKGEEEC